MRKKFFLMISFQIIFLSFGSKLNAQVYNGDIELRTQAEVDAFNYTSVTGFLSIKGSAANDIVNLNGLSELTSVGGGLSIGYNPTLVDITGLSNLVSTGEFSIYNNSGLTSLNGLSKLSKTGSFHIDNNSGLLSVDGLTSLTTVNGELGINNNVALTNVNGFSKLTFIKTDLDITGNTVLNNLDGLSNLAVVGENVNINNNTGLSNFCGLLNLIVNTGLDEDYNVSGNGANPTMQQVVDNCSANPGYVGDITLTSQAEVDNFTYKYVYGKLTIQEAVDSNIKNLDGLSELVFVGGPLWIRENAALPNIDGLSNLTYFKSIFISRNDALTNINALSKITSVNGRVEITFNKSLTSLAGLSSLEEIKAIDPLKIGQDEFHICNNDALTSFDGLSKLSSIGGKFFIEHNKALTNLNALSKLRSIGNFLYITGCNALVSLEGLSKLTSINGEGLTISYSNALQNLDGLTGLTSLEHLLIHNNNGLKNLNGLSSLTTIKDGLFIDNNDQLGNIDGLLGLTSIAKNLTIKENAILPDVNGLSHLKTVGGDLKITNNALLSKFCGLYLLFKNNGLAGTYTVSGNATNPTQQEIITASGQPPVISNITVSSAFLAPVNHKMKDVTINYTATDDCGTVSNVISVSSNEPVNGTGDGDTDPDWEIIDNKHVRLRAERSANGDGRVYTITILSTDAQGNTSAKTAQVKVAHNITGPKTGQPFKIGSTVPFSGVFWDKIGNKHTAKWMIDGTSVNGTVSEPSGNQNGKVTGSYKFNTAGVYKLQMNVTDQAGVTSYANTNNDLDAIVVIYDPNGGNTYGGGYFNSPAGALKSDPAATGKASYGFAMNYFKNSSNPKGETQFEFKVGDFEFNALNFDYLVINNSMAQFKGTGKIIGGQSGIGFTMTVTDGHLDGSGIDKIRMKIFNKNNGSIIYDNQFGASDAALPTQAVGANSIVVINNTNSNQARTSQLLDAPSITCPANKTVSISGYTCEEVVNGIDPIVSPADAEYTFYISTTGKSGFGTASGKTFPPGTSTVTYTLYNDPAVTCSFTVTVEDKTPPVITCPADVTVKCWQDIPLNQNATATDVCGSSLQVELVSEKRTNEVCENRFILTRTYKATDGSGNTSTCAQIITVYDDEKPTFIQPPPTSPLTVSCYSDVPQVPTFTGRDNCSSLLDLEDLMATFKQVRTNGSCDNRYTLTRTWTLTDACGNTATYTQIINVDDKTGPVFTNPPAPLLELDCASQIPTDTYLFAEDNCYDITKLPTVVVKDVITEQQCANRFTLTRTWIATDECGNTSSVSQVIKVNDTKAPIFENSEPPTNITVSCTSDIPVAPTQTAYDNCITKPTITYSETKTNVQCVNKYTLTRKWIASDGCGNTATRAQVIHVNDTEKPKVTSVSATPVVLWPPNHKMRDVMINYTATDNCNVTSTLSVSSSDPVNGGSDGDQAPDWEVVDGHHVRLRAEKANNGQARYYTIKISVTDGCNPPVDTSIQVVVAHNITGPQTGLPFKVGSTVPFAGVFWDKPGNKHTAKWLVDGSAVANGTVTEPLGRQNGKVTGSYKFNSPGVYKLQMNVTDQTGVTSYANTNNDLDAIVVIYDPNGGNTYGGGYFESPAGALRSDPSATGKASYGFAMNYFKNSTNPKGETQFEFKVGEFEFNALNFDYLVINNSMAQFKGTGKIIGGQSGIGFTMTVTDGQLDGSGIDKIRMKIYNKNNGSLIYDNQTGANDAALPVQAVGANSSVVINNSNANSTTTNTKQDVEFETKNDNVYVGLDATAYPNPSTNSFSIIIHGNIQEKILMQVVDMYGRVIETRSVVANSIIKFGEKYRPGTYFVRIKQKEEQKTIKLIKLGD